MVLEVFDRKTEAALTTTLTARLFANRKYGYMALNLSACAVLNVEMGDTVKLFREGKTWFIAKQKDGYHLGYNGRKAISGLRFRTKLTMAALFADIKRTDRICEFYIRKTGEDYKGFPVYELQPIIL